ncbi:MAG: serine hydrolase domain-containing protein [Ilumatobacteraceae bacterium]
MSESTDHLDAEAVRAIHELVERTAAEHHCPSISWRISVGDRDGDGVVLDGSFGDVEGRAPTSDTVYRIASMTKSFTCAAILALRDEGVFSLDDPIETHAPELAVVRAPTSDAGPIRIRHLMTMSSGLATDDAWADRHLDISIDDLDAALRVGTLFAAAPGTVWEYSNLGFGLLGRVVRRATGRPVQEHVTERLLEPLGLTRTTWVQPNHDNWARPFREQDGAFVPDPAPLLGDGEIAPMGGLWSTVDDLSRWARWLDDATPARDGADVGPLSRASRREMQEIQRYSEVADLAGVGAPTGYGYGLRVRDDPTLGRVVAHSGGVPGYGTNMRWIAGRRISAVALANVTYAPMATLTQQMLIALHDHGALPAAPPVTAPLVEALGRQLVDLLADWDDTRATELFSDNVAPDESFDRRRQAAAELVASFGGSLTINAVTARHQTSGSIEVAGTTGATATIELTVAPIAPPRIQTYSIER